jgi:septal ring factor EnvC (AmiA/AmiB activator)
LSIESKKTERLVVNEAKPLYTQYALNGVTDDQIEFFLRQKTINPDIERTLRRIVAQKKVVADIDAMIKSQQKSIDQIFTDQGRLRENMKALRGSAEEKTLLQRYTKQLDEEETELDTLRKGKQATEKEQQLASSVLQHMIQELQLDVTL